MNVGGQLKTLSREKKCPCALDQGFPNWGTHLPRAVFLNQGSARYFNSIANNDFYLKTESSQTVFKQHIDSVNFFWHPPTLFGSQRGSSNFFCSPRGSAKFFGGQKGSAKHKRLRTTALGERKRLAGGRQFVWFKSSLVKNIMCLDLWGATFTFFDLGGH